MTTRNDVEARLREVSATVLGVDSELLSQSSSPENLAAWTSIRHLSLVAAVEEEFAIQLTVPEIHAAQRFGDLHRIVADRLIERSRDG
jgi:acyl carrier protein